jgi:ParB-like chromosome segregation protein Spo0J
MEEARAFAFLRDEMKLTQKQIASYVGKSQPFVSNALRALTLPESVQQLITAGRINRVQARDISRIKNPEDQIAEAQRFAGEAPANPDARGNTKRGSGSVQNGLRSVRAALAEMRKRGATVTTSEETDESGKTFHYTIRVPKK